MPQSTRRPTAILPSQGSVVIRSFAVVYNGPTVRTHRRDCRRGVQFRVDYTLAPAENGARRRFQNQIARELKRRFNILTARPDGRFYALGMRAAHPGWAMHQTYQKPQRGFINGEDAMPLRAFYETPSGFGCHVQPAHPGCAARPTGFDIQHLRRKFLQSP